MTDKILRMVGMAVAGLLLCLPLKAEFTLSLPETAKGGAGDVVELPVHLTNTAPIAGLQCTAVLPDGATITSVALAPERRYPTTQVSFGASTGTVLVYDPDGLDAGSGLFMTISIQLPTHGVTYGENAVTLTNIVFTLTDLSTVKEEDSVEGALYIGTIPVESIRLNTSRLNMRVGATYTLTATVAPENASIQDVAWTTDDPDVAIVEIGGTVTAVAAGRAMITATTVDGALAATCLVVVRDNVSGFTVTAPPVVVDDTQEFGVPVAMANEFELRGVQLTLRLPDGIDVLTDRRGSPIVQPDERVDTQHATVTAYYDDSMRMLHISLYTTDMECGITGSGGELFTVSLIATDTTPGDYEIEVSDIVYSHYDLLDRIVKGRADDFVINVSVTKSFDDIPVGVSPTEKQLSENAMWSLDGRCLRRGERGFVIKRGRILMNNE